jgi:MerR family transcriptional regulator, heat shock protein HspR
MGNELGNPLGDASRGVFAISVASELTGLHPQTLRIYEREGLVTPSRSEGGTRRYSRDDIDRLNEVAALMAAGLNIIGVRRVLELERENRRLQAQVDALPPKPGRIPGSPRG